MRETCARVLAAALMTGAIATVVGMSALFGAPADPTSSLAAPPSSLQRAVRIQAALVRSPPRRRAQRPELAHSVRTIAQPPVAVARRLVVVRPIAPRPKRRLAATKRRPTRIVRPIARAIPPPAVTDAATPTPAPIVEAPAEPGEDEHGNGHGYGHSKEHGHGQGGHED